MRSSGCGQLLRGELILLDQGVPALLRTAQVYLSNRGRSGAQQGQTLQAGAGVQTDRRPIGAQITGRAGDIANLRADTAEQLRSLLELGDALFRLLDRALALVDVTLTRTRGGLEMVQLAVILRQQVLRIGNLRLELLEGGADRVLIAD